MIELPDHIARRIKTAAMVLLELSKEVPLAPTTVFGLVASIASGAPEAEFPLENVTIVAFVAGELEGLAVGLGFPLPLLLVSAGIEPAQAADSEALEHATSMERQRQVHRGAAE